MHMIERIARAICAVAYNNDGDWETWMEEASAAITAMLEPTEEMLDASWRNTGESKEMRVRTHAHYKRHYQAMIQAALDEK